VTDESTAGLTASKRALLEHRLRGRGSPADGLSAWLADRRPVRLAPLSVVQEQLWYFSQLAPGNPVYNEAVTIRKDGEFDVDAFRFAFREIVRRHEIWRSTYEVRDGRPVQIVHPVPELELPLVDFSDLPRPEADSRAAVIAAREASRPYAIDEGPLVRPTLIRLEREHHRLYLALHHLVFDGVSLYRIILPELIALYDAATAGGDASLPEPQIQYADYAGWSHKRAAEPEFARRIEYWRTHLADAPTLQLPWDHPRPAQQRFRGAMLPLRVSNELADQLRSLSRSSGATLFQVVAAAFAVLLHRYSGQSEVAFGSLCDLRERTQLEGMPGYCLTPLVVLADAHGDPSFLELVSRVRADLLSGLDHLVPFDRVVRELNPHRNPSANPIFQVAIALEPPLSVADPTWSLHQMEVAIGDAVGNAKFDLHLELDERPQGHIDGRLIFNTDLFETETARRIAGNWHTLLTSIAVNPAAPISELQLVSDEEQRQMVEWNATTSEYPRHSCVHDLVAAQVERTPDAVAVVSGDQQLTFRELDRRANRLAHHLRARGAGPGGLVAICVERSLEMIVGMLGILKSGAAYLPLDPNYPADRLAYMLADSGSRLLLTTSDLLARFPSSPERAICLDVESFEDSPDSPPAVSVSAEDLVYLIYTSGSTGRPNAVPIHHGAVVNLLTSLATKPGLGPGDVVVAVTTYGFDIAVVELWLPLVTGARIVLAPRAVAADGERLAQLIDGSAATMMQATPSTWQLLVDVGWRGRPGLVALCGGEALSPHLADSLLERVEALWNMYGPTETTVWSTLDRVEHGQPVTIGRPLANTRIYILDAGLRPVPVGVAGEIWIGGDGLSAGYMNRNGLTAERFAGDPWIADARMYRTGDSGRRLADGRIEHLGRLDYQIKVRGFRVEPGEIEAALVGHPHVASAVVVAREDVPGDTRLVAYLVPTETRPPSSELRDLLRSTLPDYMVPTAFVAMDALPLTPNGKLNRAALPAPGLDDHLNNLHAAPPRSDLERVLVRIWSHALNIEAIGIQDNFFDLGGHSLLAIRLRMDVERQLGVDVPLVSIFEEAGTVAGMAALIEARTARHNND
jgi:amino acid adenylation domain-containing protein